MPETTTDDTALQAVLEDWANLDLASAGRAILLSDAWVAAKGPVVPFDPIGIHILVSGLKGDPTLGECGAIAALREGDFRSGGAIQTLGDLLDLLDQCTG
jgi:hypothetical protein